MYFKTLEPMIPVCAKYIRPWLRAAAIILLLLLTAPGFIMAAAQKPETYAFVNVNVIPMDAEHVLADQTVLVQEDRIVSIGSSNEVSIPSDAN
ncbi:MAG: hypothetical protein ACK2UW_06440, partial [Anaerolineales bacterium]